MRSALQTYYLFALLTGWEWRLRSRAQISAAPPACPEAVTSLAHCNLIKMGKERMVCAPECEHVWMNVQCEPLLSWAWAAVVVLRMRCQSVLVEYLEDTNVSKLPHCDCFFKNSFHPNCQLMKCKAGAGDPRGLCCVSSEFVPRASFMMISKGASQGAAEIFPTRLCSTIY